MQDLIVYRKNISAETDRDFRQKTRYGNVWYSGNSFFIRKGLKWYYCSVDGLKKIELIKGSRQLRQCCGAPIYAEKLLLLTTAEDDHIYLTVEETENGDLRHSEKLLKKVGENFPGLEITC